MKKYVFGFDFGTLSCRGVAIDLQNGNMIATAEKAYPSGVISRVMKHKEIPLLKDWYLEDPNEWVECMCDVSKQMLAEGNIKGSEVYGIGTDFTSCTLLPVLKDGTPLCNIEEYRDYPNAWPKLWKHHGAQTYAEEIEKYAKENTDWLKNYFGNSVSSEWTFPKMLQVLREDSLIYDKADYFMEAVDWIVMVLSGKLTRCSATLGVNTFWVKGQGYPSKEFCKALDPCMENVVETKLAGEVVTVGDMVGYLTKPMADRMGLTTKTVIAAGFSDGAVAGCGAGVTKSGSMLLVMGTSTCQQMMYKDYHAFDGICSIASDGMIPGLYGYEAGQPATGDIFQWFADNCTPPRYYEKANEKGISILNYLGELAEALPPGGNGLIALDWFNGNRSNLSNYNLSGTIIGLTLDTKTEEIYRALVEANIFGSKIILDNYKENGVHISDIYAVGGIARKSPWIMQMCADVFNQKVMVPLLDNVPARGAAVCAAVALGQIDKENGFQNIQEAADILVPKDKLIYEPNKSKIRAYEEMYGYYRKLHDLFGLDDSFMKGLRRR